MPIPDPAPHEIVIKVMSVGLNPLDLYAIAGRDFIRDRIKLPAILGNDVSGIVEKIGSDVVGLQIGDKVCGIINFPGSDGSITGHGYGEYASAPANQVIKMPAGLSFDMAAGLPVVGLAAKQALEDVGDIKEGQRVLIHGVAGGVGHMAVQIAKQHHTYVFATASSKDVAFVKSLGADEVINYQTQQFEDTAHDMDLVLDTVGGEVMRRSLDVVAPGGLMVTTRVPELVTIEDAIKAKGVQVKIVAVQPNAKQLAELAQQVVDGKIRVNIDNAYPFEQLPQALAHLETGGAVQGKLVVKVHV